MMILYQIQLIFIHETIMKTYLKVHESTYMQFIFNLGFDNRLVQVTGLEEYWPYRFKVNAATNKGNMTSNFSSIFRTLQAGESFNDMFIVVQ